MMARDPFAEMSTGGAPGGSWREKLNTSRVVSVLSVIALVTFALAYYAPLSSAHSALAKEHETLSVSQAGTSTQLEKTTEQLSQTQKERDEMAAKLEAIDKAKEQLASKRKAIVEAVQDKLAKELKSKTASVEDDGTSVVVSVDNNQLFNSHEAKAHRSGKTLLCKLGKALKDTEGRVEVAGHMADKKVKNPILRREYLTPWDASAGRAVGALRVLQSCGVSGKRLSAAGYGYYQEVKPSGKRVDGVTQIKITPGAE
jgi:flagellar motor protein MotB